jgi:hypothetical protein
LVSTGIVEVVIADGPLIRKYLGKDEEKTFQVPAPTDPNKARRQALLKYGGSLTTRVAAPAWTWEDIPSSGGSQGFESKVNEYGSPWGPPSSSNVVKGLARATATPAVLKSPYPTIGDVERAIGKSDEQDKGRASTDPVCYKWFASESRTGFAEIEACFAPTLQNRLGRLELYTQGDCGDSINEFIERDPKLWQRSTTTSH